MSINPAQVLLIDKTIQQTVLVKGLVKGRTVSQVYLLEEVLEGAEEDVVVGEDVAEVMAGGKLLLFIKTNQTTKAMMTQMLVTLYPRFNQAGQQECTLVKLCSEIVW